MFQVTAPMLKRRPDPAWRVTVQGPEKLTDGFGHYRTVPGYVQVDSHADEATGWSKGPAALRAEGYECPPFEKLPTGRYSWAEACRMLAALS